jgi:hypothetical protein
MEPLEIDTFAYFARASDHDVSVPRYGAPFGNEMVTLSSTMQFDGVSDDADTWPDATDQGPVRKVNAQRFIKTQGVAKKDWINNLFPVICGKDDNYPDKPFVEWSSYAEELLSQSDWHYLDLPPKTEAPMRGVNCFRGVLFVKMLATEEEKKKNKLPYRGEFARPYIFLTLVCAAAPGFGGHLVNVTEALALKLGFDRVVLATLVPSVNTYYKRRYRFMDWRGRTVPVPQDFLTHDTNAREVIELNQLPNLAGQLNSAGAATGPSNAASFPGGGSASSSGSANSSAAAQAPTVPSSRRLSKQAERFTY